MVRRVPLVMVQGIVRELPVGDTLIGMIFSWRGAWDNGTAYSINDVVSHEGSSYVAVSNHTGSEPPSANWNLVAAGGEGEAGTSFTWQGPWDIGTPYVVNDVVEHEGSSYIAVAPSTGSEPPSADWELVAAKGEAGEDATFNYDVKNYGAIGDGTTDDTAALSATALAGGVDSLIYLSEGTYLVTAAISNLANGQRWWGPGKIITDDGFNHHVFSLSGITDFTLEGVELAAGTLGEAYSTATARAIRAVSASSRCKVLNCKFTGFQSAVQFNASADCVADNNDILNPEGWGINVQNACTGCRITNNRISGAVNEHGIYVSGTDGTVHERNYIGHNVVYGCAINGIKLAGNSTGDGAVNYCTVEGNIVSGCGDNHIYLTINVNYCKVFGNIVTAATDEQGIQVFNTCTGNEITDNTVITDGDAGTPHAISLHTSVSNTLVHGNVLVGNDTAATYAVVVTTDCDNNTISDNVINGWVDGIRIVQDTCDNTHIDWNRFLNISGSQIIDAGTGTVINRNAVAGPSSATDNAVAVFDGTTGKLIKNSVVIVNGSVVTGITEINGGLVLNAPGADVDFVVEGLAAPLLLHVHAASDRVLVGNTVSGEIASFGNAGIVFNSNNGDRDFNVEGLTATALFTIDAANDRVEIGTTSAGAIARFSAAQITFNNPNGNMDFVVEGVTATDLFRVDASADTVNVGTTSQGVIATFQPTIINFNSANADIDLRVEGTTATQLFVCDAGQNQVRIGDTTAGQIAIFAATAIIYNENGVDIDFRVEGDTATSLLLCDAGTDRVMVGTTVAGAIAEFGPTQCIFNNGNADQDFRIEGTTATVLFVVDAGVNAVFIGQTATGEVAAFRATNVVINENGGDIDLRVEGDTATSLFVCDASIDAVLVGTTSQGVIADFRNSGIVLNEDGSDRDLRVEGDTRTHMIFVEGNAASENILLCASSVPNYQSMDGGIYIADCETAPTSAPAGGIFLYSQSGRLKARDIVGNIAVLSSTPVFLSPGGRLTLTSATPVTGGVLGGVSGQTIYYTPYLSNHITVWDGTAWIHQAFTELSISASGWTNDTQRDIFAYFDLGILSLESLAWTNGTTRATAIVQTDGVYTKSGDKTRLYLGTCRRGTTNVHDTLDHRFVWNMYNRVGKLCGVDIVGHAGYNSATIRQIAANAANQFDHVIGLADDVVDVKLIGVASSASGTGKLGVGLDSTTTFIGSQYSVATTALVQGISGRFDNPAIGYHFWAALEQGSGAGNIVVSGSPLSSLTCQLRV